MVQIVGRHTQLFLLCLIIMGTVQHSSAVTVADQEYQSINGGVTITYALPLGNSAGVKIAVVVQVISGDGVIVTLYKGDESIAYSGNYSQASQIYIDQLDITSKLDTSVVAEGGFHTLSLENNNAGAVEVEVTIKATKPAPLFLIFTGVVVLISILVTLFTRNKNKI